MKAELDTVRSFGAQFGVQVTSRDGARQALDLGAGFLVCQGIEAGGHVQASRSLWDVLSVVVEEAGPRPVIAAGGIASGLGIARALNAGAFGAMLGTRFVATSESTAHPIYKQSIVDDAPPRVGMAGAPEAMSLYAGTGCGEITDIVGAAEVVSRLWRECLAHRAGGP